MLDEISWLAQEKDCSDYIFIYLVKNKNDVIKMFKFFVTKTKNYFNKKIKDFLVVEELNTILTLSMIFINNEELFMEQVYFTLLKWMINRK